MKTIASAVAGSILGLSLALPAHAEGSGHFRMGDNKQTFTHAVAFARAAPFDPANQTLIIYLTSVPVDAAAVRTARDITHAFDEQVDAQGGALVEIKIRNDDPPMMWFSSETPTDTFNSSGAGEFTTTRKDNKRVEGHWRLKEPQTFFEKTWEFDLTFATDVVRADLSGKPIAAGGGAAGKAWLEEVAALARGDADFLRAHLGDMAQYLLPKDNPEEVNSFFEMKRMNMPKTATVKRGLELADGVLLDIEGTDYDGNKLGGTQFMVLEDGQWRARDSDFTMR